MPHEFPVSVYYEDTDMGGIVYHANYLRFIERARSAFVRAQGVDQNALRHRGVVFVVSRIEADFVAPAKFEDALVVRTQIVKQSPVRLVLQQMVFRDDLELFRARVTVVSMDMESGRPLRLPAELRALS